MTIISVVEKNQLLSIALDTNLSTNIPNVGKVDHTIFLCDYRLLSILIDFNWKGQQ